MRCKQQHKTIRRDGYALLMCLMVVAVSSSIVLTLFNVLRLQTAESTARRQLVVASGLADGAREHAIALLIDNPNLSGSAGPFAVPDDPGRSYQLNFQQISGGVRISTSLTAGSSTQASQFEITDSQLSDRRRAVGAE